MLKEIKKIKLKKYTEKIYLWLIGQNIEVHYLNKYSSYINILCMHRKYTIILFYALEFKL